MSSEAAPKDADWSPVLKELRGDLENKNFLIGQFLGDRQVRLLVEFHSSSGAAGTIYEADSTPFELSLTDLVLVNGPAGEKMHLGFIRLADLLQMYHTLGRRFFDKNIRYGLGETESVNKAIFTALKKIVIDKSQQPAIFAFDHNGITLYAAHVELADGGCRLTSPACLTAHRPSRQRIVFKRRMRRIPS